jgi:hypothetical protein
LTIKNAYRFRLSIALALGFAFALSAAAQKPPSAPEEDYVKAHYTKYEYRIPMRDGVRLFTAVYVPKDTSQSYPFLMDRTPYSVAPYGEDQYRKALGPSDEFEKAGYIFVYQDVRGRFMSEGTFVEMRPHIDHKTSPKDVDDASDTYDTIDYLLFLHIGEHDRFASGVEGGIASGSHDKPVHGRRYVSRRRVHAGCELRLLRLLLSAGEPNETQAFRAFRFRDAE